MPADMKPLATAMAAARPGGLRLAAMVVALALAAAVYAFILLLANERLFVAALAGSMTSSEIPATTSYAADPHLPNLLPAAVDVAPVPTAKPGGAGLAASATAAGSPDASAAPGSPAQSQAT